MKKFRKVFTVCTFVFLYIPIFLLIAASFSKNNYLTSMEWFSLKPYTELFRDRALLGLLANSLIVAVLSSVIAAVLGTMAALGIRAMGKRPRQIVMGITNIPLTNPDIVTGISLALLFVFIGGLLKIRNVLGFATLLIAHITFNLPYVILSVMPKLRQLNPHLNEAAQDLGCTPTQALFKVVLPEIMPGVVSGAMMAFTMSLDDFVISYFVYGPSFTTLPVEIYNYTKKPLPPKLYALFTVLFLAILAVMIVMNLVEARDEKKTRMRRSKFRSGRVSPGANADIII